MFVQDVSLEEHDGGAHHKGANGETNDDHDTGAELIEFLFLPLLHETPP